MAVYIIDKRFADLGLDIAKRDKEAKIVFIQDGVYINSPSVEDGTSLFYLKSDLQDRGITSLPEGAKKITYEELIDLIEKERVYNFI